MNRLFESGGIATPPSLPGSPTGPYPTSGIPGSVPATLPGAYWFHMISEEIYNVIVAAGLTPSHSSLTQLRDAIPLITVQTGFITFFGMNSAPTGWLKCNGANVSRTTYATLFAKIGTTFGNGDGSTTFGIPELRGEFIRGWDDSRGIDVSRNFGSAQGDLVKAHTHVVYGDQVDSGTTQRGLNGAMTSIGYDVTTGSTGGAENRPRNIALLACIKI